MFFCRHKFLMILLLVGVFLGGLNSASEAASYGNIEGDTLWFNNVSDTTNSTNDPDGLFGGSAAPMVVGDNLWFFPNHFSSESSDSAGVTSDTTSSTLQMTLVAKPGSSIETVRIVEYGDYALTGFIGGDASAQISGYLTVTDISGPQGVKDDTGFSAIYSLPSDSSDSFTGVWEIEFTDLSPVTMAMFSFNNILQTSSESGTTAFIQKKVGGIGIIINPVPVPGAVWLIASGFIGLVGFRRKFGR